MKPRLYIDVDGVLFGHYNGFFQLRPNAVGFLRWCAARFTCHWLTTWSEDQLVALFSRLYAGDFVQSITYTPWHILDSGSDKAAAIALDLSFFWIEDGITPGELAFLGANGVADRYIPVSPYGRDELEQIQLVLDSVKEMPYARNSSR